MNLGIILTTTNTETNWNAFRLANLSLDNGDEVKIFLMGEGVEYEKNSSDKFNISEQLAKFLQKDKAHILACGTCLKLRNQESTDTCPISTLKDMYAVITWADKVLTF